MLLHARISTTYNVIVVIGTAFLFSCPTMMRDSHGPGPDCPDANALKGRDTELWPAGLRQSCRKTSPCMLPFFVSKQGYGGILCAAIKLLRPQTCQQVQHNQPHGWSELSGDALWQLRLNASKWQQSYPDATLA